MQIYGQLPTQHWNSMWLILFISAAIYNNFLGIFGGYLKSKKEKRLPYKHSIPFQSEMFWWYIRIIDYYISNSIIRKSRKQNPKKQQEIQEINEFNKSVKKLWHHWKKYTNRYRFFCFVHVEKNYCWMNGNHLFVRTDLQ